MAWETRGGSRQYYTRTHRVGSKRVRVYLGCGPAAEAAAAEDARRRAEREAEAQRVRGDQARHAPADELLDTLATGADLLVKAVPNAAGFHRPARRPWRRRRQAHAG
jgi:hypothetical protein